MRATWTTVVAPGLENRQLMLAASRSAPWNSVILQPYPQHWWSNEGEPYELTGYNAATRVWIALDSEGTVCYLRCGGDGVLELLRLPTVTWQTVVLEAATSSLQPDDQPEDQRYVDEYGLEDCPPAPIGANASWRRGVALLLLMGVGIMTLLLITDTSRPDSIPNVTYLNRSSDSLFPDPNAFRTPSP